MLSPEGARNCPWVYFNTKYREDLFIPEVELLMLPGVLGFGIAEFYTAIGALMWGWCW